MPSIIFMILSAAGWILAVVVFEGLFYHFQTKVAGHGDKALFCRVWWALLLLFSLGSGVVSFVVSLPVFLPISLSHLDLSRRNPGIITVCEVLGNAPAIIRDAITTLRPYIK